jgi:site-specific DNA recombinase
MPAAAYARYSSENQRPESIDDQVSACRKLAKQRSLTVSDKHIFADQAQSGARSDRPSLAALMSAAHAGEFDAVVVDDLSRLARDNHLMLSIIAELHFDGIRVISVADGLDSDDEESTLAIQVRGIFNELQLRDLKKKTLRGQIGQKERGFFVGEKTFGYRSVPVGEMRMDKKGRPRPDGYKMEIEPAQAATIVRIFTAYADGMSLTQIVKTLNEENVPGSIRSSKGWSPATISRILDNEKYAGRWIWNRTESRRDPRTGRRRRFEKPESEWVIHEDEELRIIPKPLWDTVRERRKEMHRTWPGGEGKGGFCKDQGSRQAHFPTHLLAGSMVCGCCGATIAQVSGKSGGYNGCLAATKGACENKTLVRRTLAEKVILEAIQDQISDPEHIAYVLGRVEEEIAKQRADLPDTLRLKEVELAAEERRLANFVEFIGEGRGSQALGKALVETERRVEALTEEVDSLNRSREKIFRPPPVEWISERLGDIQSVHEQRTARSAQMLRSLLGPIRLELQTPDIGRPFYSAVTTLDALALIETPSDQSGAEGGSNSLQRWRRRERSREIRRRREVIPSPLVAELWPRRSAATAELWPSAAKAMGERRPHASRRGAGLLGGR